MITVRPADERLRTNIGWLDSRHTFSFRRALGPALHGEEITELSATEDCEALLFDLA